MKNELLDRGIITPSAEISKDKINLAAGEAAQEPRQRTVTVQRELLDLRRR